ncbi:GNAT family N-acetyltransferase [Echinicola pacifica]|nr:GNAT family N-acetyltransferase [Echinicola pacifica]
MNAYEIIIRQATMNDMAMIQQLFVETIQSSCKNDYSEEQLVAWISTVVNLDRWSMALSEEYFLVAVDEGKVVGFGALKDGNYLDFIYVDQTYQRHGLAERLLHALENEALKQNSTSITTDASKTAVPFFTKMDYQHVHENKRTISGMEIINYRMEKSF